MFTPETTASTGSPPPETIAYAFSTARRPLADEIATGLDPPEGLAAVALTCAARGAMSADLRMSRRVVMPRLSAISYQPSLRSLAPAESCELTAESFLLIR